MQASLGLKLFPKGAVPKYVAFTQHMGDVAELDLPAGEITRSDGYFRLPKPALISAFQPHMHNRGKAQCMEAIYPGRSGRLRASRPGAHRDAQLREQLPVRLAHHVSLRGRGRAAAAGRNDHSHHVVARQHRGQQVQPEPEELGGQRAAHDRRDGFAWVTLTYLEESDYQQRVRSAKVEMITRLLGFALLLALPATADGDRAGSIQLGAKHRSLFRRMDPES